VYSVGIGTDAARRVLETGSQRIAPRGAAPRLIGELTDARPFGVHRLALLAAPVLFSLMVGGGVAVRAQVKPPAQAHPTSAWGTPAMQPAATPAPKAAVGLAANTAPAPARATDAAAGVIQLAILPWGEVFVDGRSRGVCPPLRAVELPPGPHTIEVRNTSFAVHAQRVEVRAGEPVRIRHQFR